MPKLLFSASRSGKTFLTLGPSPEGAEGRSHVDIWAKSTPDPGNRRCKGPEVGLEQHRSQFGWLTEGQREERGMTFDNSKGQVTETLQDQPT